MEFWVLGAWTQNCPRNKLGMSRFRVSVFFTVNEAASVGFVVHPQLGNSPLEPAKTPFPATCGPDGGKGLIRGRTFPTGDHCLKQHI